MSYWQQISRFFCDPNHDPNTVIFNGIFNGIFAGIFTIAVKGKLNEF